MPRSSQTLSRPFQVVENTWSVDTAPYWVFRSYLPQTLAGVLRALLDTGEQVGAKHGIAYIPSSILEPMKWQDQSSEEASGNLFILDGSAGWRQIEQPFNSRTNLGKDLWVTWATQDAAALAVATRTNVRRSIKVRSPECWRMRLSWHPDNVRNALTALHPLFNKYAVIGDLFETVHGTISASGTVHREVDSLIRSSMTLADHIDPWSRKQLVDSAWITLYNRIQESVGWELMVDKLMPAIADVIFSTLGYDFFELLIFSRIGKRYEEFLSYRRNMTDYGGKSMNLLLDARLVEEVIAEQEPRLIETTRQDGLMNPHLAQLAQLKEGLIVPLVHEKHVHGMISLYYRRKTKVTATELNNITHVGQVLARSIENTNAHETVRRLATIDGLTGLYNRRSFTDMIGREMRRILRYKQHFSLILVDIDNFKNYNDNNGHLMGDQLLTQFAQVIKTSVREQDIVCRYGGEEFAVILPHTDADRGLVVAEKIRNAVAETEFENGASQPLGYVSISAGVADTISNPKTYQELIDRSDRALYRAKEGGRDRSNKYNPKLDSATK